MLRTKTILFIPTKKRAAAAALTLVSAYYDFDGPSVTLTFNQPVNIDDYDGSQVTLNDPVNNTHLYVGTGGASLADANVVVVMLDELAASSGTTDVLNASATNGIASMSGAAWAGVVDYPV